MSGVLDLQLLELIYRRENQQTSQLILRSFLIECVHCHAIKNKIKNHATDKVKKLR